MEPSIVVFSLWVFLSPFIISLISGIIRGIIFKQWNTFHFSFKIFEGNFIYDPNQKRISSITTILKRLLWEQPQSFIGHTSMHLLNTVWLIHEADYYKRALVCQGYFMNGGGIALGSFIFIDLHKALPIKIEPLDERKPLKILIRHEYGHLLQSSKSGPLFIFKYGLPSLLYQGWTEIDCDNRADTVLLNEEGMRPVFRNYNKNAMPVNPKYWEYLLLFAATTLGFYFLGLYGSIAAIIISLLTIAAINLKKPV